jgi:FkbM family methyltransferase
MVMKSTTLQTETIDGLAFSYVNKSDFDYVYNEKFKVNEYIFAAQTSTPFIIDCGANIGLSVLYFKKLYPQAKIIAFEPNPETFKLLEINVQQNNFQDVQVINAAVSDSDTELEFYVNDDDYPWSLSDTCVKDTYGGPAGWKTTKVPAVKLSSYITQHVDLLKLDIEGMEETVLKEIEGKLDDIEEIRLEFHTHKANTINDLDRTLALLNRHGFKYAFARDRKVLSLHKVKHEIAANNAYLFMIYIHRNARRVWWQSRIVPQIIRIKNRIRKLGKRS